MNWQAVLRTMSLESCSKADENSGKMHLVSIGKCLIKDFFDVLFVNSVKSKNMQITLIIKNANVCLSLAILKSNGCTFNTLRSLVPCIRNRLKKDM